MSRELVGHVTTWGICRRKVHRELNAGMEYGANPGQAAPRRIYE